MTIQKPDFNQIFASQAPDVDKPPVFNNYNGGWGDESRPNNGKPTIKGFNYLQQLTDNKLLWLKQNAILPYDSDTDYPIGTVTLKDGKFQKWDGTEWADFIKLEDSQITTWSGRTQEEKNKDSTTVLDFLNYNDAENSNLTSVLNIPDKSVVAISEKPIKGVYGYGALEYNSNAIQGFGISYNVARSSMYGVMTETIPFMGFPSDGGQYTVALGVGGIPDYTKLSRTTVVGTSNLIKAEEIERCEAFGNGALHYMRKGQRNTAIGTIALEWFGTTDPQGDKHAYWNYTNSLGAVVTPTDPSWDQNGLETSNPGLRAKIAAIQMPTTSEHCMRTVAVGRDAFNNLIRGTNNVAVGYGAGGAAITADSNTAVGAQCLNGSTITRQMTGVGFEAGKVWHEGERSVVIGHQAGVQTLSGIGAVNIGVFAGVSCVKQTNTLFLGYGAGNNYVNSSGQTNVSNILEIGCQTAAFSGNMSTKKYGVNTTADKLQGTFHVVTSLTGATSVTGSADDLVVENNGPCGITIMSASSSAGNIAFANSGALFNGGILYDHAANTLKLRAGATDRVVVSNTGFTPNNDNAYTLGAASSRWSVIHAGTGTISTSDERLKQQFRSQTQREKDAALEIKNSICLYKFNDAVDLKGDGARWHCGVKAQQVASILESHGLNWQEYAFVCFDEWDEQEGVVDEDGELIQEAQEAGSRYAIRYDELTMFILSSI